MAGRPPIFQKSETKILLGLERIRRVLRHFGDPQRRFNSCVVTGTVGKGQIATNMAHNLSRFGKIALYTSPHLLRFSERMKIVELEKEVEIGHDEIELLSEEVFGVERKLGVDLTFFEHATVMAFLWFASKGVDFAVLEVGMGGRLDAVATASSYVGVIGRIHYDHTEFLGDTLWSISLEKAQCVAPEATRITIHDEGEEQFEAIRSVSSGKLISGFLINELERKTIDIFSEKKLEVWQKRFADRPIYVDFFGPEGFTENAVLASFSAFFILKEIFGISQDRFDYDVRRVKGRVEKRGNFIYDGGHNVISAEFLKRTLDRMRFVVAFMRDKNWRDFIRTLEPKIEFLFITKTESERACDPAEIKRFADALAIPSEMVDLWEIPKRFSGTRETICFTGTFYLYKVFDELTRDLGNR